MDTSTSIKAQQGLKPIKKGFIRYEGPEHHDIKPQFRVVGTESLKKMNHSDRIIEWVDYEEAKNLAELSEKFYKALLPFQNEENKELFSIMRFRLGLWKELLIKG